MEREYTVGALLTLVAIFVIALIVYFTVPGFNDAIKEIADDVFKIPLEKEIAGQTEEQSKDVLEKLAEGIQTASKGAKGCVYDANLKPFSEKYEIRIEESAGKNIIALYEKNEIIKSETLPDVKFCVMESNTEKKQLPFVTIDYELNIISDKSNQYNFLENWPKFYNFDENNLCFLTEKIKDYEKLFNYKRNCKTGEKQGEKKAKEVFENFISLYKKCKESKGLERCRCSKIDLTGMKDPYSIQVLQRGTETKFFLNNADVKETIKSNRIAKISNTLWIKLKNKVNEISAKIWAKTFPKSKKSREKNYKITNYEQMESIKSLKQIIYYQDKHIYLAEPGGFDHLPLCSILRTSSLKFDSSISKEDYKQKLLSFSERAEPYFEQIYKVSKEKDIDFFLVLGMMRQESNWKPYAVSFAGAVGLLQLMPGTMNDRLPGSKLYGQSEFLDEKKNINKEKRVAYVKGLKDLVKTGKTSQDDRFDYKKNIIAGIKHVKWIRDQLEKEDTPEPLIENILAAYNAGLGKVKEAKGVPNIQETKDYVRKISLYYEEMKSKD